MGVQYRQKTNRVFWVSGTIKRQKLHFVRVESTTKYRELVSKAYAFETNSSFLTMSIYYGFSSMKTWSLSSVLTVSPNYKNCAP
jgi:hypothetical protein